MEVVGRKNRENGRIEEIRWNEDTDHLFRVLRYFALFFLTLLERYA